MEQTKLPRYPYSSWNRSFTAVFSTVSGRVSSQQKQDREIPLCRAWLWFVSVFIDIVCHALLRAVMVWRYTVYRGIPPLLRYTAYRTVKIWGFMNPTSCESLTVYSVPRYTALPAPYGIPYRENFLYRDTPITSSLITVITPLCESPKP